jgi:hypothetical protein
MGAAKPDGATMARADGASRKHDALLYAVELWGLQPSPAVELVLARAASAQLAQAIFAAAQLEHPQRRITLRKGKTILSDTAMRSQA